MFILLILQYLYKSYKTINDTSNRKYVIIDSQNFTLNNPFNYLKL